MTVGLPGTGIGGFFYLLTALWMPIRELGRFLRGKGRRERWPVIGTQSLLAVGAIAAAWATGWLFALVLTRAGLDHRFGRNLLRIAPIVLQAAVLGTVAFAVQALRIVMRARRAETGRAGGHRRAFHSAKAWNSGAKDRPPSRSNLPDLARGVASRRGLVAVAGEDPIALERRGILGELRAMSADGDRLR